MTTIFSKIISRDIPAHIVYEDELAIAFLDNQPVHLGHTLIVPKTAYVNIFDLPAELFTHLAQVAHSLAPVIRDLTAADGMNVCMNNNEAAGQEVWHAHLHLVPRFTDDQRYTAPIRDTAIDEVTVTQFADRLTEKLHVVSETS